MIYDSYFQTQNEAYFMMHSSLASSRPTLLFIHGLGDSSISYRSYLHSQLADHYNLLIPDLLGHGKSSASSDYCFQHQIHGIEAHIEYLQKTLKIPLSDFILIAHSMGGIHATLLCESKLKPFIKALINVEGSITQFGSFIAENMMHALAHSSFDDWFDHFKQKVVYEDLAKRFASIRPYYASLEFCHLEAFLNNAMEMYQMSRALKEKYSHAISKPYIKLSIPKIYCYGDTLSKETLAFLQEHQLTSRYFPCQNHFLLSECLDDFVLFINEYVRQSIHGQQNF